MADGRRPRALLLTPVIPSDRGNGLAMRAGMLLTGLAQAFAVDLAVTPSPPSDPAAMTFSAALCGRIEVLADAATDPLAARVALLATAQARERASDLRPLPELCCGAPPAWAAQVSKLAVDVDLIAVFRLYLAPLVDAVLDGDSRPALLIDVDELDADSERSANRPQQASAFERLERYYLPRFDHVIACSAGDTRMLGERHRLRAASAIPNAVRLPEQTTEPTGEIDLLFVGNLGYAPNAEAVHWLCESVLPLLGEVSVTIAGSGPGDGLRALERDPRVTVIADPADVAPWYAAARVAVVPLQHGGGSRLKLIEALAHGRAVVSTTVGADGQPWESSDITAGVVIADTPDAFADACRNLLADRERARKLGEQGRETVRTDAAVAVVAPRIAAVGQEALLRHTAQIRARPLLTAALIVRDEEVALGNCLDSLNGVADEVVIVDTGSSDATVAIARERGARILHQAWADDFAAPRNHGLDRVRGDWVLYIDADERVAPLDRRELERRLASSPATAMRILLRPTLRATPYYEYRLWRNDPRIRFSGVMHEQVVDAIHAAARQDGRSVDDWPGLLLEHVGYEGDQRRKHTRNLPLLQAQLEHDPSNIYNWRHLARVLDGLGRPDEAAAALARATSLALSQATPSIDGGLAWAEHVRARHQQGDDVSDLLELGRARWPQHWLICWMDGIIAEQQGRLDEAEHCFRSLLAVDLSALPIEGIAYDQRMFGEWAYASLGLVLFRAGRDAEAAAAYAGAELMAPQELEYKIKRELAEARARRGGHVL